MASDPPPPPPRVYTFKVLQDMKMASSQTADSGIHVLPLTIYVDDSLVTVISDDFAFSKIYFPSLHPTCLSSILFSPHSPSSCPSFNRCLSFGAYFSSQRRAYAQRVYKLQAWVHITGIGTHLGAIWGSKHPKHFDNEILRMPSPLLI